MPSTAAPRVNFSRPGELDLLGSLCEYGKMFPVFSLLPKKMFSGIFLNSSSPSFFLLMESTRAGFFPSGILGIVVLIYPLLQAHPHPNRCLQDSLSLRACSPAEPVVPSNSICLVQALKSNVPSMAAFAGTGSMTGLEFRRHWDQFKVAGSHHNFT